MVTMTSTLRCLPSSLQTWEFWRASSRVGTRIMAAGQGVRDVVRGATGSAQQKSAWLQQQASDETACGSATGSRLQGRRQLR